MHLQLQRRFEDLIMGKPLTSEAPYYHQTSEIIKPLKMCYQSLTAIGMSWDIQAEQDYLY